MKTFVIILGLFLTNISFASTIIVDQYGNGQFKSIQPAIDAASSNDTVKVWPGQYFEQVTLNKNITLMGSGYENTTITGGFNPTITVSSGRLQWFTISSTVGVGINMSAGVVKNCVVNACATNGIVITSGTSSSILNCIIVNNGTYGVSTNSSTTVSVTNCISISNGNYGFCAYGSGSILNLSYSDGSTYYTTGSKGCINVDPSFTSITDFHISESSPCWDKGNPTITDPDGSNSDMGYFGGTDCPIYPTVFEILITPNGGTVNLTAKGRANY